MAPSGSPTWAALLEEAVKRPGLILEGYSRFHGYSLGNQMAAMFQCLMRAIPPGPIATLQRWNELRRRVKPGEKALVLCMPVSIRVRDDDRAGSTRQHEGPPRQKTIFIWKPRWFVLAQTEGEPLSGTIEIPCWNEDRALPSLDITRAPFALTNGNVQGYAEGRAVAVSPLAELPAKTLFHELGHILLGHTAEKGSDHPGLPKTLTEAEAEAVALLCVEAVGLPGADYARGYIQLWYGSGRNLPEYSAQRIFKVADMILRAGRGAAPHRDVLRGIA